MTPDGAGAWDGDGEGASLDPSERKKYVGPPNHLSNQKLQDVWLSED